MVISQGAVEFLDDAIASYASALMSVFDPTSQAIRDEHAYDAIAFMDEWVQVLDWATPYPDPVPDVPSAADTFEDRAIRGGGAIKFDWPRRFDLVTGENGTRVASQGFLYAAWAGQIWPRTAELIRAYHSDKWDVAAQTEFGNMLVQGVLPTIRTMWRETANWLFAQIEAKMNIAVFRQRRGVVRRSCRRLAGVPAPMPLPRRRPWVLHDGVPVPPDRRV